MTSFLSANVDRLCFMQINCNFVTMVKPTVTVRVQRNTASYRVPKDL